MKERERERERKRKVKGKKKKKREETVVERQRERERERERGRRAGRSGVPLSKQKIPAKIACTVLGLFPARRKNRNVLDNSIYKPIPQLCRATVCTRQ